MLTVLVKISRRLPWIMSTFILFGIYEVQVEDGVVFGYTLCKEEKRAPSLKFIKIKLENRLEYFFKFGIQLQVGFGIF